MKKPLAQSLIFHCFIVIVLIITSWGFFARKEKIPEETPIIVQLMPNVPMGAKTNVKPAPKSEDKQPPKPPAPKPPAPKPSAPVPKPPTPKPVATVKPTPKPDAKPVKTPPKKDDLTKMLDELDKKDKKPVDNSDLDSMLKDLDKKPPAKAKSAETKNTDINSASATKFDETAPVSQNEANAIGNFIAEQLKQCWSPPAGAENDKNLVVVVDFDVSQSGVMKFVGFENNNLSNDPRYRAAEDAARRAILDPECNPLRQLPPMDKYNIWKEMTLTFDPKQLN